MSTVDSIFDIAFFIFYPYVFIESTLLLRKTPVEIRPSNASPG